MSGKSSSAVDLTHRSRNCRRCFKKRCRLKLRTSREPRWRRLLKRRKRTVADGSPHSRAAIIGRHGVSFAAGASLENMVGNDPESAASYQRQAADFRAQACRARRYRRFDSGVYGPAVRLGRLQHIWHRPGSGICRLGNHPRNQEREKGHTGSWRPPVRSVRTSCTDTRPAPVSWKGNSLPRYPRRM